MPGACRLPVPRSPQSKEKAGVLSHREAARTPANAPSSLVATVLECARRFVTFAQLNQAWDLTGNNRRGLARRHTQ